MNDMSVTPTIININDLLKSYEEQLQTILLKAKNLRKNIRAIKKVQISQKEFEDYISSISGVSKELLGPVDAS